ncbi:MAG: hypothetical protein LQ340_004348 [Diploschistes diacapsis]|nr:MAG: hypothetical protein LQ340_004348 [Diploschistes diacapsis]
MGSRLEANSSAVRKRIEKHKFEGDTGDEYGASKFGGFPEYFRRKKIKLQNRDAARRAATDKPQIFRGVVAHVNGYTQPSLNDLHDMIVDHGGGFLQYLDGKTMVTHVIASNLTPKKKIEFRQYRIVKPAWVVDSIKAGRLLPWNSYRVVDEGAKQNVLGLREGSVVSQTNTQSAGYREQTDTSWYTSQIKDSASRLNKNTNSEVSFPSTQLPAGVRSFPSQELQEYDIADLELMSSVDLVNTDSGRDPEQKNSDQSETRPIITERDLTQQGVEPLGTENPPAEVNPNHGGMSVTESPIINEDQLVDHVERELGDAEYGKRNMPSEDDLNNEFETAPDINQSATRSEETPMVENNANVASSSKKNVSPSKRALTAEEHNAVLLSDPKTWKSTVVNPGFLKQYYEESRLHHLSHWKAELKSQMQALAAEQSSSQKARRKRPAGARRYIFHVDFDSFFSAVSLKSHPEWVDKPAVVAHGAGSGSEIASCNYPARAFGVKNGMWMKAAQELCPDLKVLPYDFKAYEAASRDFYAVALGTGGIVQSVSVDEALIDLSVACVEISGSDGKGVHEGSVHREQAKAEEISQDIRSQIRARTGCEVSVGIGGNILLAKVALRKAKPAGQFLIKPDAVLDIIGGLTVQDLPGVACSIGGKLEEIGVKYVKDIRELTKEKLMNTLGPKTGEKLWDYSRGIDRTEVGDQVIRRSVSAEVTWGVRFVNQEQADEFVRCLCEELQKRLLNEAVKGRQFTMKIMRKSPNSPLDPPKHLGHGKCDVHNRSVVLGVATNDCNILAREAISIMKGYGFPPGELRGVGVQMTKLEPLKKQAPLLSGSQRPLQFKQPSKPLQQDAEDIMDSPQKPEKYIVHPAAALATPGPGDEPASLLNTTGTQFILPTQVDPDILAELPENIRTQLARKGSAPVLTSPRQPKLTFKDGSKTTSTTPPPPEHPIPTASQLDPDTLAALPDDLRAEILAHYHKSPSKPSLTPTKTAKQAVLPQTPHKNRTVKPSAKMTPTKPKPGLLGRGRGRPRKTESKSTLAQANFNRHSEGEAPGSASNAKADDEISPEFLAALPEDIRAEVLEQQRRERLKKSGLDMAANRKKARPPPAPYVARTVEVPERPPRPAFTSARLTSLPELREAVRAWHGEFAGEEPNEEDVKALGVYLGRVVKEEGDMGKAVALVRWLEWVVGQDEGGDGKLWDGAVEEVKVAVQAAVRERALGEVVF